MVGYREFAQRITEKGLASFGRRVTYSFCNNDKLANVPMKISLILLLARYLTTEQMCFCKNFVKIYIQSLKKRFSLN